MKLNFALPILTDACLLQSFLYAKLASRQRIDCLKCYLFYSDIKYSSFHAFEPSCAVATGYSEDVIISHLHKSLGVVQ